MKKIFFITFYFLVFCSLNAQFSKTKWGEITKEELDYIDVTFDKGADAVILSEKGNIMIQGSGYTLKVNRRIKILTEKGLDQANLILRYYADNSLEDIKFIKAQTLNQVDGRTIVSSVNEKEIFDVKINELYNVKRLAFPNVKVGSIIEYQYQLNSRSLFVIDAWNFQHEIPVVNTQVDIDILGNLDYTSLLLGKQLVQKYAKAQNLKSWSLSNVPSFNSIKYTYNTQDISNRLRLQLKGYLSKDGYKDAVGTWKDLSKEIIDSYDVYSSPGVIKKLAESIPNGENEFESLQNVLNYFAKNFRTNGIIGIYTNKLQKKIIDERMGSVADLNNILHKVLKFKNINSELVLLSSRSHGKIISSFPYLRQFDYVANIVTLSNQNNFLIDASDLNKDQYKYAPLHLFNDYGFVLKMFNESFIKINQHLSTYETNFSYTIKNNGIQLARKDGFNGYFYNTRRSQDQMKNRYINQPIDRIFDDTHKLDLHFDINKYVIKTTSKNDIVSDLIIIQNPLKDFIQEFDFKEDNRIAPIEFNFPFSFLVHVDINIPNNYELIQPSDFEKVIKISEDLIYHQKFVASSSQLKVLYQFYLGKAVFDAKDYGQLKRVFEEINKNAQKEFILKRNKVN